MSCSIQRQKEVVYTTTQNQIRCWDPYESSELDGYNTVYKKTYIGGHLPLREQTVSQEV
ncbi:MAG: hypothetical protein AMXMBFR44_6780 [Candidatus Campbellbacteria bacterium]